MPIRIAAIDVSHWHSIYDAAYLKHLVQMEDVEVVALHDDDAEIAAKRARAIGVGAVYADHRRCSTASNRISSLRSAVTTAWRGVRMTCWIGASTS